MRLGLWGGSAVYCWQPAALYTLGVMLVTRGTVLSATPQPLEDARKKTGAAKVTLSTRSMAAGSGSRSDMRRRSTTWSLPTRARYRLASLSPSQATSACAHELSQCQRARAGSRQRCTHQFAEWMTLGLHIDGLPLNQLTLNLKMRGPISSVLVSTT